MRKKDIITIVVSLSIMAVALYFGLQFMGVLPKGKPPQPVVITTEEDKTITGNIDQETLESINKLNDYGEASLDNIGRINPFAPVN